MNVPANLWARKLKLRNARKVLWSYWIVWVWALDSASTYCVNANRICRKKKVSGINGIDSNSLLLFILINHIDINSNHVLLWSTKEAKMCYDEKLYTIKEEQSSNSAEFISLFTFDFWVRYFVEMCFFFVLSNIVSHIAYCTWLVIWTLVTCITLRQSTTHSISCCWYDVLFFLNF